MRQPKTLLLILVAALNSSCGPAPGGGTAPAVATPGAPADKPGVERETIPAGNLMQDRISFEFAIYYLPQPEKKPLAELDQILRTSFSQFQKVEKIADEPAGLSIAPRLRDDVHTGYAPPGLQSLQYFGRGISREQAEMLQGSETAIVLDFAYPREHVLDGMRAALQITHRLAESTGGLIWDEETREVFSPAAREKRRLADWGENIVPDLSKHTVIHAYKKDDYVRAITLGMQKFGLPDIVVDGFPWSLNGSMASVVNLFAQVLAEGAEIKRPGEFDLDLRAIRNPLVREPQLASLKPGATTIARLTLLKGIPEEGDPSNRLIEIVFGRYEGPDVQARQEAMLSSLFGSEDKITRVKHDAELLAASERARARRPALRAAFNKGLPPGEFIQVKAPFATPDGGHEYMWVEITAWAGDKISGLLRNEPFHIPDLHAGQIVEVSEANVFDYLRNHADGTSEGNETGMVMKARARPDKRTEGR